MHSRLLPDKPRFQVSLCAPSPRLCASVANPLRPSASSADIPDDLPYVRPTS